MRAFSRLTKTITLGGALLVSTTGSGCGSNVGDLATQYANAAATTALDQWLTSLSNDLYGTPLPAEGSDQGGGDMTPGGDDGSGGGTPGLVGDPTVGEEIFTSYGCSGCHCAGATGGCALSAPAIIGAAPELVANIVDPLFPHPVKPTLSDQDQADLVAFLASLAP